MKNIKKLLSLLLCGIMLFGMFPASLFAADGDTGDGSGTISETVVPNITWSRTFEYKYRLAGVGFPESGFPGSSPAGNGECNVKV